MDFMLDTLADGRAFRTLNIVKESRNVATGASAPNQRSGRHSCENGSMR
jgi:hypothetical protein